MARLLGLAAAFAAALVLPAAAFAGSLTLHPAGFGPHSYAAWKAQQGQPDSSGNGNHALYFQKDVPTTTIAAGTASVQGLAGEPATVLNGLSWEHRDDGHCGAGAPRWDIFVTSSTGVKETVFLGCAAAAHTPGSAPGWTRDSYDGPAIQTAISAVAGSNATLRGLSIVFDEGNEAPMCSADDPTNSCVRLDNIIVNDQCWTGPMDNGSGAPTAAQCTPAAFAPSLLPAVVPTDVIDSALMAQLADTFPDVAPASWVFYTTPL